MANRRIQRHLATTVFAVVCVALLSACSKRKPAPTHATSSMPRASASVALRLKPKSTKEFPTTDADIYFGNLDGQIQELTRLTRESPDLDANFLALSAAHHTRGRFRGDLREIQLGIDTLGVCLKKTPDNAQCLLMRAEQEQSLHRFGQAREDLEHAKKFDADPVRVATLEMDLDWNAGRYATAIEAIRKARIAHPSFSTWLREAQLNHDLGLENDADAAFEAAEDRIVDTGPLLVAHLNVQRGMQKVQTGRIEEACVFFRAAVERIPNYVAGNEHLAEALRMLGKNDEATRIYEKVVQLTDDPEFLHALAELYAANGKTKEAAELESKALAGYEVLLREYPEAMYWHGSEFFMAIGKPQRALELLQKNVALRPNSVSFVALANAELANNRMQDAKLSIDKALAMPVVSASLFWTASRIYRRLGDAPTADKFRARAETLNPRIARDEPEESDPR